MEKFTEKEYKDLCAILSEIHMHPGMLIYNDNKANLILEKLYNWFNNNTYGFIEVLISYKRAIEDTFLKIYLSVKKLKVGTDSQIEFNKEIKDLNNWYSKIEDCAKAFEQINEKFKIQSKSELEELLNFMYSSKNNVEAAIKDFEAKKEDFNAKANIASKDLISYKKSAIDSIEEDRTEFHQSTEIYKKEIEETTENLIKKYNDLKEYHENIKNKIFKDINDIQNAVNREQLAAYFLNERKKLKGDIELPVIIYGLLLELLCMIGLNKYNSFFRGFTTVETIIFLMCIFLLMLPLVQFLYYKFFVNTTVNIEPFDELKALLTPYWTWLCLTFVGMACIAKVAYQLYYINSTKVDNLNPYLLFANLPIFMILVWFTWFCSKQFSYTKQICDEYEYKYALSKSYLSYRDEAKNISDSNKGKYDAIMVALLDSVIKNIATSPVKSVKADCHTPFTEVFSSIRGTVDVVKDGRDVINK